MSYNCLNTGKKYFLIPCIISVLLSVFNVGGLPQTDDSWLTMSI